jgi:hypothetical protein
MSIWRPSATISWRDTQDCTGTITYNATTGVFQVHGSHRYPEEGTKQVTVTIHHASAADVSVVSTAHIVDAKVAPFGTYVIYAFPQLTTGTRTVAAFTDPGGPEPLTDYSASIAWGDGDPSLATITFSAGAFTVQGSHTYFTLGTFIIATTIRHDSAAGTIATAVAHVGVKVAPFLPIPGAPATPATSGPAIQFVVPAVASAVRRISSPVLPNDNAATAEGRVHTHNANLVDRLFSTPSGVFGRNFDDTYAW